MKFNFLVFISLVTFFLNSCNQENTVIENYNQPNNFQNTNEIFNCESESSEKIIVTNNKSRNNYKLDNFAVAKIRLHINYFKGETELDFQIKNKLSSAIISLNETFAAKNLNEASLPLAFRKIASGDSKIQFIFDPNKDLTIKKSNIEFEHDKMKLEKNGGILATEPKNKLNIWISKSNFTYSYAKFPDTNTDPYIDGVFIKKTVNTINGISDKLFAHEIGHWLGLHHTFGNKNATKEINCTIGDKVDDTTPHTIHSRSYKNLFPYTPIYSDCNGERVNSINIMDYTHWLMMFTKGQVTRMHSFLLPPTNPSDPSRYRYVIK